VPILPAWLSGGRSVGVWLCHSTRVYVAPLSSHACDGSVLAGLRAGPGEAPSVIRMSVGARVGPFTYLFLFPDAEAYWGKSTPGVPARATVGSMARTSHEPPRTTRAGGGGGRNVRCRAGKYCCPVAGEPQAAS
jgi:hypothetical protein